MPPPRRSGGNSPRPVRVGSSTGCATRWTNASAARRAPTPARRRPPRASERADRNGPWPWRGQPSMRLLEALGIDHRPVELDDDGIDIVDPIVDFHGPFRSEDERGLGQSIGARRGGPDDGGAAHLARGMSGMRVDDVVIANPVLLEESFIVAGGRDRGIDQRNARDDLARALAGIANADHPGFAEPIADDSA